MRCRTCFEVLLTDHRRSLDEIVIEKEKTLSDAIFEIAKIDTKNDVMATDFRFVCIKCSDAIKEAYEFVLQIQKVNELVLTYNTNSPILDETEIIFILGEEAEIKPECHRPEFASYQQCNEIVAANNVFIKVEEMLLDPIVQLDESIEVDLPESSKVVAVKAENNLQLETGYELTRKRKRGRPRKHLQGNVESQKNICNVCGKTFMWYKDLIRHAKQHSMEPDFECEYCDRKFMRKDKLNDHMKTHSKHLFNSSGKTARQSDWSFAKRLYEKQNLKSIQCKLCDLEFEKISELNSHLILHKDPLTISFEEGSKTSIDFAVDLETQTKDELKLNICRNISSKNFSGYYSITNAFGYELCLSDSDETDDNEEGDGLRKFIYKCLLCESVFNRKYKIFSHAMDAHLNEKWPLRCNVCKTAFVCGNMFRRHEKTHCRNKTRKLQCTRCPGKFMWDENSENHECSSILASSFDDAAARPRRRIGRPNKLDYDGIEKSTNKLQCDQCDKTFIWPKDLTRHMRLHVPDREKFTCPICQRKFNRKDNMQVHMKIHGEEAAIDSKKKDLISPKQLKVQEVDVYRSKPHGCKVIECILCLSKQMRMSDLKVHLMKHQSDHSYVDRWESVEKLAETLYPELGKLLEKEFLIERISADLAEKQYQRFYSITNQIGYELDLFSSETETDSESEDNFVQDQRKSRKCSQRYRCEICYETFERKYKIFEHQAQSHNWKDAPNVCSHCGARFVNLQLLVWHQKRLCKNPLKRFVCKKCPLRFMWKQNLEAHLRTMHIEKSVEKNNERDTNPLQCVDCNRTFMMQKDLTRHLLMQTCRGQQVELIKCLFCARKFYCKENLYAHMTRHGVTSNNFSTAESILCASNKPNGTKDIRCRICNIAYGAISELRAHLNTETNSTLTPQHYSLDSSLNYTITNSLGFEMQIDDSETEVEETTSTSDAIIRPPYQCAICNLFAKRRYEMAQHQLSMHKYEQLPFKCDRCIFRTVSQEILSHHMGSQCYNTEKEFECEICHFKFMWPENLETHKRLCHLTMNPNEAIASKSIEGNKNLTSEGVTVGGQIIFRCNQCPCRYNRKDRLNAHMKKMHSLGNVKANITKKHRTSEIKVENYKQNAMEKKFLCAFCGRALTSSSNLIIHTRRHTGEKPFKCDFCQMAFPRSSDLLAHRRKHTGEKPHACTICEKAFARSYKLMLHMRTHTGERPHKCTYCEKSFTQSNDLTLHIRRHTGERPYVCEICGERFIQGTALKNHRTMRGHYEIGNDLPEQN